MAEHDRDQPTAPADARLDTDERDRLRAMLDAGSDLLLLVDKTGSPTFVNAAVHNIMGYEPDELLAVDPLGYMHPDDVEQMAARLAHFGTDEAQHGPALVRVQHRDGHWRWLEVIPTDRLHDPNINAIVINGRDVTDRIEAKEELALEKDRFRNLVDSIPDMVARLDQSLQIQYLNPAADEFMEQLSGGETFLSEFGEGHDSQRTAARRIAEAFDGRGSSHLDVRFDVGTDGLWLEMSVVPETRADGTVEAVMIVARDITRRKATEDALSQQVLQDPLTGLANRVGFELELNNVLQAGNDAGAGDESGNELIAVLYLDVDNFKLVNDTRGHAEGDSFLQQVAHQLCDAVRPEDLLARLGGDEFAILPRSLTSIAQAERLAERIHSSLVATTYEQNGVTVGSASIGIAQRTLTPGRVESGDWLIVAADRAMYEAKRLGRGRTVVAD